MGELTVRYISAMGVAPCFSFDRKETPCLCLGNQRRLPCVHESQSETIFSDVTRSYVNMEYLINTCRARKLFPERLSIPISHQVMCGKIPVYDKTRIYLLLSATETIEEICKLVGARTPGSRTDQMVNHRQTSFFTNVVGRMWHISQIDSPIVTVESISVLTLAKEIRGRVHQLPWRALHKFEKILPFCSYLCQN